MHFFLGALRVNSYFRDMAERAELLTSSAESSIKKDEASLTHLEAMDIAKKSLADIISVSMNSTSGKGT